MRAPFLPLPLRERVGVRGRFNVLGAKLVVVIRTCGIVMRVTGVTFLGLMRLMH